jgi:hypothetical protein
MKYRKLRIAWSVGWGVLAAVICLLWISSYVARTSFQVLVTPTDRYYVHSLAGSLAIQREPRAFVSVEILPIHEDADYLHLKTNTGVLVLSDAGEIFAVSFSYWLLQIAALLGAVVPWMPRRFSLRTLLIATTLLAVILGLVFAKAR